MRRLALALCLLALLAAAPGCLDAATDAGEDLVENSNDVAADRPASAEGELAVHAIDVGQADATLVVGPEGDTMLIDTGDWRDDGEPVLAYLAAHDVDRIDHLVSTHAHADHVGGAAAVIDHYETERDGVGAVYDPGVATTSQTYEDYLDAIEDHDVTLFRSQAGDEIPLDGARAVVLNPPAERESDDLHENSLVVRLRHGDHAFLFTGDAQSDVEERLVAAHGDELAATGYQAGHHGSATSSSPAFLDAVEPAFAIVSSDFDSQYGHPHDEVLDRFADRDVDVYWTGVHGTIVARSDGETVRVATAVEATTDPTSIRDAPAAGAEPTAPVEEREQYDDSPAAATCCPAATEIATGAVAEAGSAVADATTTTVADAPSAGAPTAAAALGGVAG